MRYLKQSGYQGWITFKSNSKIMIINKTNIIEVSLVLGGFLQITQTWANAGVILLYSKFFSNLISESTTGYTFTPCVGSFTSPDIDTR